MNNEAIRLEKDLSQSYIIVGRAGEAEGVKPAPEANDGESQSDENLVERVEVLRNVAFSLWKEVKTLTSHMKVTRVENGVDLYNEVRRFETDIIERALAHTHGNQTRAARLLGVNLTTLNSKIKRYKIRVDDITVPEEPTMRLIS